jgi:hypothetical protein
MRFRKTLFALTLVAPLGLGASSTEAAFLTGTLGFDADITIANPTPPGNVATATSFTFATSGGANTQTTTGPATGSFAAVAPGTVVTSSTLNLLASPYLTLSQGTNQFQALVLTADVVPVPNSRTIDLTGILTGTGFDPTPARFILQFNQAGGPNTTISYAGTLSAIAIPEPSSCVLMGVGGIFVMAYARFRRARPC